MAEVNKDEKNTSITPSLQQLPMGTSDATFTQDTEKNSNEKKSEDDGSDNKNDKKKQEEVPYLRLFRFATKMDKIMIFIGLVCSAIHGVCMPFLTIIFGSTINTFDSSQTDPNSLTNGIKDDASKFLILAGVAAISSYGQIYFMMKSANNQCEKLRFKYMEALLRQDIKWFDAVDSGELTARVANDVAKIEQGIGDKVGSCVQFLATVIGGFVIGFIYGWQLTLVVLAVTPLLVIAGGFMGLMVSKSTTEGQAAYSKADGVANEAFSMIRTVVAFSGEEEESNRYKTNLEDAYKVGIKKSVLTGVGMGFTMMMIFLVEALSFWVGCRFLTQGIIANPGDILTVVFSIIIAAFALGQASPNILAMTTAKGAAPFIFGVLDRKLEIDQLSSEGLVPDENSCKGEISFQNVNFAYVEDKPILKGMEFELKSGETIALIGASGCGKSTSIQLIERFYNPTEGFIKLDGIDISKLNIQWFRSQVGIVGQMPVLFNLTIAENIALGAGYKLNPKFNPNITESLHNLKFIQEKVSEEMIIESAKRANAHDFIMNFPDGYDTKVGARGAQMSGGQKQRLAIARALVRNPKVLLLDEATSALDSESERTVQEALEKAAEGRTTIVIAHRLSTVQNANHIAVVDNGVIIEMGSHDELMNIETSHYKKMKELQALNTEQDNDGNVFDYSEEIDLSNERFERKLSNRKSTEPMGTKTNLLENEDNASGSGKSSLEGVKKEKEQVKMGFFATLNIAKRAFSLNRPESMYLFVGVIGCILAGSTFPLISLPFSEITFAFILEDQEKVNLWAIVLVAVGVGAFFGNFLQFSLIGISGEKLTFRSRIRTFNKIVRQPVHWFDHKENSTGVLITRLGTDANMVRSLTADALSVFFVLISALATALIIGFISCPKLAAVVLACLPALVLGSVLQFKLMSGFTEDGTQVFESAGRIANEAVDNIRTVHSLNCGYYFLEKYQKEIIKPKKGNNFTFHVVSIAFGFAEFMTYAIFSLAFWYGAELVSQGQCEFSGMLRSIIAVIYGAMQLGQAATLAPNFSEGAQGAKNVFEYLDMESDISVENSGGDQPEKTEGNVEFQNIGFRYPTRPNQQILFDVNLKVPNGKTTALVGTSGCGKSTLISLTERFYNAENGHVMFDGKSAELYNLKWLRSQIGIVSQEPDLFNKTIRENIAYGFGKTEGVIVTDEQIEWAAKKANAHEFIMKLPLGYDSPVGERGGMLSGGQKQRVAIARALVRNPKILLLDEATSALDSESEKVVQEALESAREGRTTIVIAHRLSTIQNSDKICYIGEGKVLEEGTHNDLMRKKGRYYELVMTQSNTN